MAVNDLLQVIPTKHKLYHRSPKQWEAFDLNKVGSNEGNNSLELSQKGIYTVEGNKLSSIYDPKVPEIGKQYGDYLYELEGEGKIFNLSDDNNYYRYGDNEGDLSVEQLVDLIFGEDYPLKHIQQSYIYSKTQNLPFLLMLASEAPFSKLKGKTGMEILEMLGYSGYRRGWETIFNPAKLKLLKTQQLGGVK